GLLLLGYNFIVAPAALIILSFFPLLAESRGYGSFLIGALLAIASVVTAIAQPIWGKIADERGLAPLLMSGGFGSLATLSLLGLVDVLLVAVLATLLAGFTLAALVASASTAAVEAGKSRGMGAYMGLFHSAGSTGQAIMPLIYGLVLGTIGVDGLLVAVGIIVTIGSVSFLLSARIPRRSTASVV
ncbi:MAG: MFS transporter, partial [Chloroflexota bacterium]